MKKTVRIISAILVIMLIAATAAACSNREPNDMLGDGEGYFGADNDAAAGGPDYSIDNSVIIGGAENAPEGDDNYVPPTQPGEDMEENYPNVEGGTLADEGQGKPVDQTSAETANATDVNEEPPAEPTYGDLILNQFVNAAENSFSTFSADVDTASYTYFRKLVNSGYGFKDLRNSGSIFRTEEFINYFRYEVDQPKDGELFGLYSEMTACPWNEGTMLLRLTLQAENAVESKGNNLVFLIDVSGSMNSRDKLQLLKQSFSYLVSNLSPSDRVSIVTYSGKEEVVLDGCLGGNSTEIMNAINSLKASGSTNGEAGITTAYMIAEKHFIEGGNNRIIMASDGDLNVGISSKDELTRYIEEKRDQGVYLSVLGFGTGNYKDEKMEALADNGNGVYYYIDGEGEAEKVFGTYLSSTLYTVANDVKLQIEFNKDAVESYRLIGYDNRILDKDDFENDQKDAGEVGASHQVTVCYEIKLKAEPTDSAEDSLMTLRVRYKKPGESISLLNEYSLGREIIKSNAGTDTRFIAEVVKLASLLRNKNYSGDVTVSSILEELNSLKLTDGDMTEFKELVAKLAE